LIVSMEDLQALRVGTGRHWEILGGTGRQEKALGVGLGALGR